MASSEAPSPPLTGRRQWHALVIGVDRYPAFPSRQLSGCVNDAEAMSRFLREKVKVADANLRCLLSPRLDSDAAGRATAANIRAAFATTVAAVVAGDHLVLYCAGHGIRIERQTSGDARDRHYGFVPEDVSKAAKGFANLILGREIYEFLRAIEQKGATATVIADTCHSGGATRGIEDEVAVRSLDIDPLSREAFEAFVSEHPALRSRATRAMSDATAVTPFGGYAGGDFVMLTGCLDSETSKECKEVILGADGTPVKVSHGLMTHTLLKELERESTETIRSLRWMDLHERLRGRVAERALPLGLGSQTPVLEGRPEKTVFGGEWQPFDPGFTVRRHEAGALTIDGGELHGLEIGATVAIYPPGTRDFDSSGTGVEAVITSATAATSTAQLNDTTQAVTDRSRARLVTPSSRLTPIVVRLHPDAGLSAAMRHRLDAEAANGRFTLVAAGSTDHLVSHAELRRDRDGWVLLNGGVTPDNVVAYFRAGTTDEAATGAAIASGLTRWAHYLSARDRRAVDDSLRSMLDVRLLGSRIEHRPDDMSTLPALAANPTDGVYALTDDDWLWAEIRVKRSTALRLQIGWLAFSDDGNILPLWPPQGADNSFAEGDVLYVGRDREQALPLGTRDDQRVSLWTLKVVACTVPPGAAPLDIWSMEQGTVQDAFTAAIAAAGSAARGGLRTTPPAQPAWCTWDFRVAVTATKEMRHDG
jgi:hypothetical protein